MEKFILISLIVINAKVHGICERNSIMGCKGRNVEYL